MTEKSQPATSDDDVDLLLFLQRIFRYFRKFRWVFIIAIILGLATGILMYRVLPKVYSSSMVLHSFMLTNQEQIQITENWNSLIKRGEHEELARLLNCRPEILHKVSDLKADEIQKVFNTLNPHGFTIDVQVSDNAILDELQKGIVYGFENSEYVKERLAAKRERLKLLIDETDREAGKLDSLNALMENLVEGKSKAGSPLIIDAAGTNRQLIELSEKNLAYKEELEFTKAVQILQSFSKFSKPVNPKLLPWLIIGLLFFMSIAFLYTIYRSVSDKMKARGL